MRCCLFMIAAMGSSSFSSSYCWNCMYDIILLLSFIQFTHTVISSLGWMAAPLLSAAEEASSESEIVWLCIWCMLWHNIVTIFYNIYVMLLLDILASLGASSSSIASIGSYPDQVCYLDWGPPEQVIRSYYLITFLNICSGFRRSDRNSPYLS